MISVLYHENGHTQTHEAIDRAWLDAGREGVLWVDLSAPSPEETRLLSDVFHFHEL